MTILERKRLLCFVVLEAKGNNDSENSSPGDSVTVTWPGLNGESARHAVLSIGDEVKVAIVPTESIPISYSVVIVI